MEFAELIRRCRKNIFERYPSELHLAAQRRLERELDRLQGTDVGDAFANLVSAAPEQEARGGAFWLEGAFAGSLAAYLVDLTTVDPIAYEFPEDPVLAAKSVELAGCPEWLGALIRVMEPTISQRVTICITHPEYQILWRVGEYLRRHGEPDFDPSSIPTDHWPTYLLLTTFSGLTGRFDSDREHRTAFEPVKDRTPETIPALGKILFPGPNGENPKANRIRKALLIYRTAYLFLHRSDVVTTVLSNPYGTAE